MHKMLNSYLEFASIKYPMLEEDFNYIQSFDAPIFDVLYKLISEKVLLPETKNQAEFNKEIESILYRQLSKMESDAKKLPFFIAPINTGKMISYMLDR
jgi:hypothetical protein